MSVQGKKLAMIKCACEFAQAIVKNAQNNIDNPLPMEIGLFHIQAQAAFSMRQIRGTSAERFNDDGTLKPTPELRHGEWHVKMGGLLFRLEKEYIPREPKNFEANV